MELSSLFTWSVAKNIFSWTLRKFGLKIVPYKKETRNIATDYPEKSPECIGEKSKGATFFWHQQWDGKSERYFEINDDTRIEFQHGNLKLWIKKPN